MEVEADPTKRCSRPQQPILCPSVRRSSGCRRQAREVGKRESAYRQRKMQIDLTVQKMTRSEAIKPVGIKR